MAEEFRELANELMDMVEMLEEAAEEDAEGVYNAIQSNPEIDQRYKEELKQAREIFKELDKPLAEIFRKKEEVERYEGEERACEVYKNLIKEKFPDPNSFKEYLSKYLEAEINYLKLLEEKAGEFAVFIPTNPNDPSSDVRVRPFSPGSLISWLRTYKEEFLNDLRSGRGCFEDIIRKLYE